MIIRILLFALAVLGGFYVKEYVHRVNVQSELAARELERADVATELGDCVARILNIQSARENREDFQQLDLDLFDVPAHWLRPESGTNSTGASD